MLFFGVAVPILIPPSTADPRGFSASTSLSHQGVGDGISRPHVTVFNDMLSNVTFSSRPSPVIAAGSDHPAGAAAYFEGTNIMVYVRGTEDEPGDWWDKPSDGRFGKVIGKGGVLVNAHYDSYGLPRTRLMPYAG